MALKSCSCATDNGNDVGYLRPTAPSPELTDAHIYGQTNFEGEFTNDLEGERRPSHGTDDPFFHGTKVYRVFISAKSNPHDAVLSGHDAALNGHHAEKY